MKKHKKPLSVEERIKKIAAKLHKHRLKLMPTTSTGHTAEIIELETYR